ncbi:MAG: thioredoxin family protein [bacterium]
MLKYISVRNRLNQLSHILFLILFILSFYCFPGCSLLAGESVNQKNYKKIITKDIQDSKIVILYFYSDKVSESLKSVQPLRSLVNKHKDKVTFYQIEADKNRRTTEIYSVQYVPTVFILRPEEGIVRSFEIDVDLNLIEKIIEKKERSLRGAEIIAHGIAAGKPSLLFFMADWCFYCQKMRPAIEKFKADFGDKVNVHTINIDYEIVSEEYLVFGVPDVVILDSLGLIIDRYGFPAGYDTFLKTFRTLGVELKKDG